MTTEALKQAGDVVSIGTVAATFVGWLPSIAAVFTIIWTCLRIYESQTVQDWLKKRKK